MMMQDPQAGLAQGLTGQTQPMRDIDQIAQMLMQGVTPEELIQMGVPQELVMAAIDAVTQQATAVPPQETGLAGMQVQGM